MYAMNFQQHYAGLTDEELLTIAADRTDLVQDAAVAIDSELARRGLSYQDACSKKREVARLEYKETRRYRRQRKSSKYFVARMNGWMVLIGIVVIPLLDISLMVYHVVPEEWDFPIITLCMGAFFAVLMVQPWLRRTVSFWLSLVISCAVQVLVAHWINVRHALNSRGELKGAGFLAMLAGYSTGAVLFLLMQRLKTKKEPRSDALPANH